MSTLADLVAVLDDAYPPELAEDWDAVGLVCGDPTEEVRRVLLAVDATEAVVDEAIRSGAQALVVHHPLLLRGVHGVGADTPKGALVHRLVRSGCALFTAHTNADRAAPGVSDALAAALGLRVLGPVEPGSGAVGPGSVGLGRVGELAQPETLRAFTARVAGALPVTAWGVRAAGDPERVVRTVAVCGGAGDGLLDRVRRAGVDAYVTADLRHHPVDEHLRTGGPALVDVAHWASEAPWCTQAQDVVSRGLGGTVTARVSSVRTDPWSLGTGPGSVSVSQATDSPRPAGGPA